MLYRCNRCIHTSRVDTEKRLDNVGRLDNVEWIVDIIRSAGGESSALLFRALYAVPFPAHALSTYEAGRRVVLLEKAYFEMKVK